MLGGPRDENVLHEGLARAWRRDIYVLLDQMYFIKKEIKQFVLCTCVIA